MKKHLFLAALAGLLWALPASAAISYTLIKADTTALNSNEMTVAIPTDGVKRMWLDLIAVPLRATDMNSECDTFHVSTDYGAAVHPGGNSYAFFHQDSICTAWVDSVNAIYSASTLELAVKIREALPAAMVTDSTYAIRLSAYAANTEAAVLASVRTSSATSDPASLADSTAIPWTPRASYALSSASAAADTTSIGMVRAARTTPGATEINAIIPFLGSTTFNTHRSVRVDFVNPDNGAPYTGKNTTFSVRVLKGPSLCRLRWVVGMERP
jgi:hypothetical protein